MPDLSPMPPAPPEGHGFWGWLLTVLLSLLWTLRETHARWARKSSSTDPMYAAVTADVEEIKRLVQGLSKDLHHVDRRLARVEGALDQGQNSS